jgi:hypothetical protein
MTTEQNKTFSNRLIEAMKASGHTASRSPSGICITTLSKFAGASEQICRRYIRGDGLPDYEKVIKIAACLNVSPGWLLFGEEQPKQAKPIDDETMHYILHESHLAFKDEPESADEFAGFVLELARDVREINAPKELLHKIINMAVGSIASHKMRERSKHAM